MNTIAAIQSQYASAARRVSSASMPGEAQPVRAVPRVPGVAREEPRRHELLDAMNRVLEAPADGAAADDRASQSVLRFAHALMHDLRTLGGEEGAAPADGARAQAWADLPQRLSALASAASKPAADALVAVAEMPDEPNPVTTATVAVHIMKVPSSRLLEAFISMHRALGQQVELQAGREREALAALASKLAGAAKANPSPGRSAGTVLDVKA
jgi:hypothetical protein